MKGYPPFPVARWGEDTVTFTPGSSFPEHAVAAVVVFAIRQRGFVLADIPGRGWCVPSGRPEPGETPLETAVRETWEEIGAELIDPRLIGFYTLVSADGISQVVPAYTGNVGDLGPLPEGTESRGVRVASREELASLYWLWDDLMERMFNYALSAYQREESEARPVI